MHSGYQIIIMGLIPSIDSGARVIYADDAKALAQEYESMNVEFAGESNAKRGKNVVELMRSLITKCAETSAL